MVSAKDVVEIAAHVAEVIIALVAVAPALKKGWYLLRTAPRISQDERHQRFRMMASARMGPIQRWWVNFLHSCRIYDDEVLSWREWWNRRLLCPAQGHRFFKQGRDGNELVAHCRECWAVFLADSKEELEEMERSGRVPWHVHRMRWRDENPKGTVTVLESSSRSAG